MADNNKTKVVRNASKAYGYNYASLADMAKDGVEIPQMRLSRIEGEDYIEYLSDGGEWQLGARVVVPVNNKGMNEAQAYGAALTYARRYTVQLARQLACDDDAKLEAQPPARSGGVRYKAENIAPSGYVIDDGSQMHEPGSMTPSQQRYIGTILRHEYGMDDMKAMEAFQTLKPKLTSSKAASAIIEKMKNKTPIEEL